MAASQLIVVSASAGSGKTRALALRYLELLMAPEKKDEIPLENILAITFTNKAALEMKERILEFLKKLALGQKDKESEEIRQYLGAKLKISPDFIQKRAGLVLNYLVRHYNFFQVATIDSFINSLLFACAFELNLAANFKMEKGFEAQLKYSLDEVIDEASQNPAVLKVFKKFLKQYLFLENKSPWYPKNEIFKQVKNLVEKGNSFGQNFAPPEEEFNFAKEGREILALLKILAANLPQGTDSRFQTSLTNYLEKVENFSLSDKLPGGLLHPEPPMKKGFLLPVATQKLWRKIRASIKKYSEAEASQRFYPYLEIFNLTQEYFQKIKTKENLIFLEELNKTARLIFSGEITLPEIYFRLATKFNHFLIDEFQDTSIIQWQNLSPLVEEALASGGSLFYVGDKKQAIYRFRGGEVALFDQIPRELPDFAAAPEILKKNFRSLREIISFNNQLFSGENLKRFVNELAAEQELEISFEPVKKVFEDSLQIQGSPDPKNKGFVKVEFIDSDNQDERDEITKARLIPLIKDLEKRGLDDTAILCRDNQDVQLVSSWLLTEKIPVESEKTLNIRENFLIKEIVSFLRFLNSPIDNLAFASFISGEILGKISSLSFEEIQNFLFEARLAPERGYLYRRFAEKFPKLWQKYFEEFFKNVGFSNPYELVVSILKEFQIPQNFPQHQVFFLKFLEIIKNNEDKENDLNSFLEYFAGAPEDELYVKVAGSAAVKVLTIHKAKGLQFEAVILPFFELAPRLNREAVVIQDQKGKLNLFQLKKIYLNFSEKLKKLYQLEFQKSLLDELNALYVAATRPKKELYIFIPKKTANRKNSAWFFISQEPKDFETGQKIILEKPGAARITQAQIPPPEYQNWLEFLKEEFTDLSLLVNRQQLLKGEILHFILSYIIRLDKNFPEILKQALEAARTRFPEITDFSDYQKNVEKLVSSKKLKEFFTLEDGEIFTEAEIVDATGATFRLDRLLVKKDEVWIIDYKSSAEEKEKYFEQVKKYGATIVGIYPRKKVRGFLIYLDSLAVEEVTETSLRAKRSNPRDKVSYSNQQRLLRSPEATSQ